MANSELVKKLCNLAQLDIDATFAYEQALKNIDDQGIYKNIDEFRNDHMRHVNELSKVIQAQGGKPPKKTQDFKGYVIEGFTSLRSITGTVGALKAMETNEQLTSKTYKKALDEDDIPIQIRTLVEKNYADEQRQLNYIRTAIRNLEK